MKCVMIIVAAGVGKRMQAGQPKQYLMLHEKPILVHTLQRMSSMQCIDRMILVTGENDVDFCRGLVEDQYNIPKVASVIAGGKRRQDSVYNGLLAAQKFEPDIALVHDGVRPFCSETVVESIIKAVGGSSAAIPGIPITATVKAASEDMYVEKTVPRESLWMVQTPQGAQYDMLMQAYQYVAEHNISVTDEAMALECIGKRIQIIHGNEENIKITTPFDLKMAELILDSLIV